MSAHLQLENNGNAACQIAFLHLLQLTIYVIAIYANFY